MLRKFDEEHLSFADTNSWKRNVADMPTYICCTCRSIATRIHACRRQYTPGNSSYFHFGDFRLFGRILRIICAYMCRYFIPLLISNKLCAYKEILLIMQTAVTFTYKVYRTDKLLPIFLFHFCIKICLHVRMKISNGIWQIVYYGSLLQTWHNVITTICNTMNQLMQWSVL